MSRKSVIIICLTALAIQVSAAPRYFTKMAERIAKEVKAVLPAVIPPSADIDSVAIYKGRAVHVKTNAFGDIKNIGYRLFPTELTSAAGSGSIYDFLEQYALSLDLNLDGQSPAMRMYLDHIVCSEGNISMLKEVGPATQCDIEEIERRMYRVSWTIGKRKLVLTIPSDCQLLLGSNAIELEDNFERWLNSVKEIPTDSILREWNSAKWSTSDSLSIADDGNYLGNSIYRRLFFKGNDDRRQLIVDRKKPLQSIGNILLTGYSEVKIPMSVTLDRYGYKKTTSQVTVAQLVAMCKIDGCKLYLGVKTQTDSEVTATMFALNTKLAYNHVFSIVFPLDILDRITSGMNEAGSGVKATAYTYIPLHDITEKFFEY